MKPIASLSLDLDNEWAYVKTHGDAGWESYPSYLDIAVPRFLGLLAKLEQRITVFVVGQDAALEKNHAALRAIAQAGHEIGNHSFRHEPWLGRYSRAELETEIRSAGDAIAAATGVRPRGFRGPGFSLSREALEVLADQGYRYDCSTFPTYIGPLARAYYFMTAKLDTKDRAERSDLFGSVKDGLRPITSYRWALGDRSLTEIPVTTFPVLKIPFHFSYVLYIASIAPWLALPYFRAALLACRLCRVSPSLLLHPLDFLDGNDVATLSFFPAMALPKERKLALLEAAIASLRRWFEVVPVGEHAASLDGDQRVRAILPSFA
jgi:peptidoglycan/xylan/chitin deacetylase (PgdA/CDA1 family)